MHMPAHSLKASSAFASTVMCSGTKNKYAVIIGLEEDPGVVSGGCVLFGAPQGEELSC